MLRRPYDMPCGAAALCLQNSKSAAANVSAIVRGRGSVTRRRILGLTAYVANESIALRVGAFVMVFSRVSSVLLLT